MIRYKELSYKDIATEVIIYEKFVYSSYLVQHGSYVSNMKPVYVKVQKHSINESYLVTIPNVIAQAISLTKGDVMKTVLDADKRVIMEKV